MKKLEVYLFSFLIIKLSHQLRLF